MRLSVIVMTGHRNVPIAMRATKVGAADSSAETLRVSEEVSKTLQRLKPLTVRGPHARSKSIVAGSWQAAMPLRTWLDRSAGLRPKPWFKVPDALAQSRLHDNPCAQPAGGGQRRSIDLVLTRRTAIHGPQCL
jgi:hypothetical protein